MTKFLKLRDEKPKKNLFCTASRKCQHSGRGAKRMLALSAGRKYKKIVYWPRLQKKISRSRDLRHSLFSWPNAVIYYWRAHLPHAIFSIRLERIRSNRIIVTLRIWNSQELTLTRGPFALRSFFSHLYAAHMELVGTRTN